MPKTCRGEESLPPAAVVQLPNGCWSTLRYGSAFSPTRNRFVKNSTAYWSLRKVGGHDLVYGELLVGDKGGRQAFLKGYQKLYRTKVIDHSDVADFVRAAQLHGLGIGWS